MTKKVIEFRVVVNDDIDDDIIESIYVHLDCVFPQNITISHTISDYANYYQILKFLQKLCKD